VPSRRFTVAMKSKRVMDSKWRLESGDCVLLGDPPLLGGEWPPDWLQEVDHGEE
jgi:hypothetical protein